MAVERFLKYKNVLIARFSALGDVAMTVPVVYSVCTAYPDTRFIMITQQVASSLFINAPSNIVVIGVDVKVKYHGVKGMCKLFRELRRDYSIDLFIDLHDVIRTYAIEACCLMSGVPFRRIRKGRSEKRKLTRSHGKQLHKLVSSHERYADVFRRAGFDFAESFVSLFRKPAEPSAFAEITIPKQKGEIWIAIAPFAKHKGKIYPLEKMEQAVATLSARSGTKIFLFGGGGSERDTLHEWAGRYGSNVISMAEKRYGFPKELALLSYMDVMVSMDSANMHLASLANVPVVSIWGATHPYCGFTGWKQPDGNIVQADLPCRPCSVFGNRPCRRGDYACLAAISPEMIIEKIDRVLSRSKSKE